MKSTEFLLVLIGLIAFVAVSQAATDYCAKELCGTAKHIACNATGQFAKTCSSDRKLVEMTPDIIKAILARINKLRNTLASGNMTKFQPCPRMASVQWNAELSTLAKYNCQTCKYAHDACHNTKTCPQSGQNIGIVFSDQPLTTSPLSMMLGIMDDWWAENKDTTMNDINKYPESPKSVIGHFTEMVIAPNNEMGCSGATFKSAQFNNNFAFYFVCNFKKINIINGQIYPSGKTASKCTSGTNPNYKALCSESEKY